MPPALGGGIVLGDAPGIYVLKTLSRHADDPFSIRHLWKPVSLHRPTAHFNPHV